jgi:hypothetical protein
MAEQSTPPPGQPTADDQAVRLLHLLQHYATALKDQYLQWMADGRKEPGDYRYEMFRQAYQVVSARPPIDRLCLNCFHGHRALPRLFPPCTQCACTKYIVPPKE